MTEPTNESASTPKKVEKPTIKQSALIPILKQYLDSQRIDLNVNETGICHGLSSIYCFYVAQGKEDVFLKNLQDIETIGTEIKQINESGSPVSIKMEPEMQNRLNRFIGEILFTFLPQEFNKELSQSNGLGVLNVDVEDNKKSPLQERFNIGLTTTPTRVSHLAHAD